MLFKLSTRGWSTTIARIFNSLRGVSPFACWREGMRQPNQWQKRRCRYSRPDSDRPDDTFAMTELSRLYLPLGRNADALRLSRQAADISSIEKDALAGANFQIGLAQIEARAGAPEEAIKRLRRLLSIPAGAASIAGLKMDPVWDPIRNRQDFQWLLSGKEQIGPNK